VKVKSYQDCVSEDVCSNTVLEYLQRYSPFKSDDEPIRYVSYIDAENIVAGVEDIFHLKLSGNMHPVDLNGMNFLGGIYLTEILSIFAILIVVRKQY